MPSMVSTRAVRPSVSFTMLPSSMLQAMTPSPMSFSPACTCVLLHVEPTAEACSPPLTVSTTPLSSVFVSLSTRGTGHAT